MLSFFVTYKRRHSHKRKHVSEKEAFHDTHPDGFHDIPKGDFKILCIDSSTKSDQGQNRLKSNPNFTHIFYLSQYIEKGNE